MPALTLFTCCCHITVSILETKQRGSESAKYSKGGQPKDEEEGLDEVGEEEHGDTLSGACGENYASDEFWRNGSREVCEDHPSEG